MKQTRYSVAKRLMMVCAVAGFLLACSDDDNPGNVVPPRLFKPPFLTDSVYSRNNTLSIGWYPIDGAQKYIIERGSMDFSNIEETIETTDLVVKFANLPYDTEYGVRLKAISSANGEDSRWAVVPNGMKTEALPYVNRFNTPSSLSATTVEVSWNAYSIDVTRLVLYQGANTTPAKTISDAATLNSREYEFVDLTPETEYRVVLETADQYISEIGSLTFTTYPVGVIVVGIPDGEAADYYESGTTLIDLVRSYPNGSTFLLPQGYVYNIGGGVPLNFSATFIGGVGEDKVIFQGTFNFNKGYATPPSLRLHNLMLPGGGMFISGGEANTVTELVEFKDCVLSGWSYGIVFCHSDNTVVNNLVLDNTIVQNLALGWPQYAHIFSQQSAGSTVNNFTMINSTGVNMVAGVIRASGNGTGTIRIENSTFNNFAGNRWFFIDFENNTFTGSVIIRNNLFGKKFDNGTNNNSGGVRIGGQALASTPNVSGNYATSDYEAIDYPIPGMNVLNASSTDVFLGPDANPADPNSGFSLVIQNATLKRYKVGDPRWYR
ncbi:MAG: DUF5123 domain-containing protein [Rikenellaceae bacterium]|nr:DUF5123 domain-containing protein [Rikenellaceae bacterium]